MIKENLWTEAKQQQSLEESKPQKKVHRLRVTGVKVDDQRNLITWTVKKSKKLHLYRANLKPSSFHAKKYQALRKKLGGWNNKFKVAFYKHWFDKHGCMLCHICNKEILTDVAVIDHIIPLSKGGTNDIDNLGAAHWLCNSKKWNKLNYRIL